MSDTSPPEPARPNSPPEDSEPSGVVGFLPAWRSVLVLLPILIALFLALVGLEHARRDVADCLARSCCASASAGTARQIPVLIPTAQPSPTAGPPVNVLPDPIAARTPTARDSLCDPSRFPANLPAYCAETRIEPPGSGECVSGVRALFDPTSVLMRPLFWILHGLLLGAFGVALALLFLALVLRPLQRLARTLEGMASWLTPFGGDATDTLAKLFKAFALTAIPTATFVVGYQTAKPQSVTELESSLARLEETVRDTTRDVEDLNTTVRSARGSAQQILDAQIEAIRQAVDPILARLVLVSDTQIPAVAQQAGDIMVHLNAIQLQLGNLNRSDPAVREAMDRINNSLQRILENLRQTDGPQTLDTSQLRGIAEELRRIRQTLEGMGG